MFCKVLISKNGSPEVIQKYLDRIGLPNQLITTSTELKELLKKKNIKSFTIQEKFPEIGSEILEIHKNAHKECTRYRTNLSKVRICDVEIFSGLENKIADDLILLEKIRLILSEKMNVVFVFERFSFALFSILKMANQMGYKDENMRIDLIQKQNVSTLYPDSDFSKFETRNKLRAVYSISRRFPISRTGPLAKSLLSTTLRKRIDIDLSYMEKMLDEKLGKNKIKQETIGIFFTTDIDDFLKPHYSIIEQLREQNIPFQIFVIDLPTREILSKRKIPFIDLFEEVYLIMEIIRKSPIGRELESGIFEIAAKHDLDLLFLKRPSLFFENEIYHGAAIVMILDNIMKRIKMRSVLVAIDGSKFGNLAVDILKKYHVPTVSVESGILHKNLERIDLYKADKICIYGIQGLDTLRSLGYDEKRIFVTGSPRYDHLKKIESAKSKNMLEKKFNIKSNKKLVVVAMGRWHGGDEDWMPRLVKFCNQNNFEIIIKVHPLYKTQSQDYSNNMIDSIQKQCKNLKYTITYDLESSTLISAADLVITDYSNMGVESILLDKPLITANFLIENLENIQRFHEQGAAIYIEKYDEMENIVTDILCNNAHVETLQHGRERAARLYNHNNDGKASQRIVNLLVKNTDRI